MPEIEKILYGGVKKIYSSYSPECRREEAGSFRSSSHGGREICFVLKGESSTMLNGNVYSLTPGSCLFIDSWVPHAFGYRKHDRDLLHLWIWFNQHSGNLLNAVLMDVIPGGAFIQSGSILSLPSAHREILQHRINMLEKEKCRDDLLLQEYLRDPVNSILAEFAFARSHADTLPSGKEEQISSAIQSVKNHILVTCARDASYENLERYSGYSRSYLAHAFRKYTGTSIGEFINKVRLDYVESAVKKGMTQKEIAYELGFSSPANFWAWLRKHKK